MRLEHSILQTLPGTCFSVAAGTRVMAFPRRHVLTAHVRYNADAQTPMRILRDPSYGAASEAVQSDSVAMQTVAQALIVAT